MLLLVWSLTAAERAQLTSWQRAQPWCSQVTSIYGFNGNCASSHCSAWMHPLDTISRETCDIKTDVLVHTPECQGMKRMTSCPLLFLEFPARVQSSHAFKGPKLSWVLMQRTEGKQQSALLLAFIFNLAWQHIVAASTSLFPFSFISKCTLTGWIINCKQFTRPHKANFSLPVSYPQMNMYFVTDVYCCR